MKISVITRWYNEEFFAPFFLNHYAWADEIIIMLEKITSDCSAEIAARYPNARVCVCGNGDKLNDRLLSDMMSDLAAQVDADWIIRADADEFIFSKDGRAVREVLEGASGNLIYVRYMWVYRNVTETDLDPSLPPLYQRRHGGAYTIWPGMGATYTKPAVVRPQLNIRWAPGDQRYLFARNAAVSPVALDGVHWQMADCEHAIARNIKNESRLSEENIRNRWGVKNFTPEMIREECARHLHDPRLF